MQIYHICLALPVISKKLPWKAACAALGVDVPWKPCSLQQMSCSPNLHRIEEILQRATNAQHGLLCHLKKGCVMTSVGKGLLKE